MNFCESKYAYFGPAIYTGDIGNHSPTKAGNKKITELIFELMWQFKGIFSKPLMSATDPLCPFSDHMALMAGGSLFPRAMKLCTGPHKIYQ